LDASATQGKEVYNKICLQCHLSGKSLASQKSAHAWKTLFATETLSQLHLDKEEANASWDYFKAEAYQQEIRHLKDFMQKYSSDRGKHNSCN
jgi:cytochrome c5